MEPAAAVAAAPPQPLPAAIEPAGPAPAQDAGLAITPPSFDIDFETATTTIGTLPSLHPLPSHANIRSLERVLFERLETLQSAQSEEWGFRGLAEQPAEYALKSATPWVNAPNPGPHRPIGLNAQATRDAEAIYDSEKAAWQAQATVTRAINAALNVAVPKAFRRNSTPAGGTIIGTSVYRSNHDHATSFLPSALSTARPHLPNAMQMRPSLPPHGIQPNPSKRTSIGLKTAMSPPSLLRHRTPSHK